MEDSLSSIFYCYIDKKNQKLFYGVTDTGSYKALSPLSQANVNLKYARKLSVVRVSDNIM